MRTYAITHVATVGLGSGPTRAATFTVQAKSMKGAVKAARDHIKERFYEDIGTRIIAIMEVPHVDLGLTSPQPNEV